MKCQTFGAFFLAFALPTLAANLEQPAVEIAESPEVAVQEQSQNLERRLAPLIPILTTVFGGLLAGKSKGKRDLDLDTADHDLERRIAPIIPILTSIIPSLFAAKGNGKRDLDGSNDAEAVLAELAGAIEGEPHLDRRFFPGLTILTKLLGKGKRDLEGVDQADAEAALAELAGMIDTGDAEADAHLNRRFLPVISLFKNLFGKGKRDLEGVDQADAEAALAELAGMIDAQSDAQSDASLERRRFRLPISNLIPLIPSIFGNGKRDLEGVDQADAEAALAELAGMIDAQSDASLERRRLRLPFLPLIPSIPGLFPSSNQKNARRSLDEADAGADADAAYAELAAMIAADDADTDAHLDRRFFPGLTILTKLLGKGKRDLDGLDAADAHLDRRFLPVISLFKNLFGKGKRDLEASDAAALADLSAALSAGEGDAALQRRFAPAIPIITTILGGLFAGKGKGKRDLDLDTADHDLERRIAPIIPILTSIIPSLFASKGKGKRDVNVDADAAFAELAAALSAGEGDAALQRRFAPAIPIITTILGGLFAGKGKGKRDVDADTEAALAELASLVEADPSLLGRRDDEAAAVGEQTTSSHLSGADLAEIMAPVLEQAAAGEAEKRDETVARMRVARGIVI